MLIAQDGPSRAARLGELHRSLLADVPRMREVQFRIGRALLEIRRLEDFTSLGSTTYAMYCESSGLSPVEGREYLAMVQAAAVLPEVEARVLEAKLTPQKATVIHELQKTPKLHEKDEDLIALALSKSAKDLIEDMRWRKDKARIGRPPVVRTMNFSAEENDAVDRTKVVVGRMLDRFVTDGEAVGKACNVFLDIYDDERKAERLKEKDEKAKASLKERPVSAGALSVEDLERSRHIAAQAKREILRVAGDRCWVKDCPNRTFLDYCHRRPFRAGGANVPWNLLRFCHDHHAGFDGGDWRLRRRSDGVWILVARTGRPCGELLVDVGKYLDQVEEIRAAQGRAPP